MLEICCFIGSVEQSESVTTVFTPLKDSSEDLEVSFFRFLCEFRYQLAF